jgi:hypothetical protein
VVELWACELGELVCDASNGTFLGDPMRHEPQKQFARGERRVPLDAACTELDSVLHIEERSDTRQGVDQGLATAELEDE